MTNHTSNASEILLDTSHCPGVRCELGKSVFVFKHSMDYKGPSKKILGYPIENYTMDAEITSTNYLPPVVEQKRIYYCCYHYQKGVFLTTCLPLIILLFSCLTVVLLYNVIALKTELANLQAELRSYRRLDRSHLSSTFVLENNHNGANIKARRTWGEDLQTEKFSDVQKEGSLPQNTRSRRHASDGKVHHSCLQLIPDKTRNTETQGDNTFIPWILSLKQGTSIEESQNKMLIKESGLFFIYGQVWYRGSVFTMGHIIQRKKIHVVGDDPSLVTLFTCIQNMPESNPNNSCFTAGIAKLDEGDELQLIILRNNANISLDGHGTFFGAIKLF
ncbi:tumor necrosis factor ligand superfamily member 13B [Bufo bufo]|uniref:tumor necrosis factor ligand superfamily member 13B n=1 Tax=Bufo bufo TaxID=8384 RepID=UPI001ABE0DD0|nr:tumor necrosis factor ligand superfamily member 13B [Bufo bufo]